MPCSEGMAAAGFKVAFKGLRFSDGFKRNIGFNLPWEELGGMRNLAGIVLC